MGAETGFHPAESRPIVAALISPVHDLDLDRSERVEEVRADVGVEVQDEAVEAVEEDEVRVHRVPHDPGKPTYRELCEHLPLHWPFRSWCRHCVRGRGVAPPHKRRTDEDREFGR